MQEPFDPINKDLIKDYNRSRPSGPKPLLCYAPFNSMVFDPYGMVKVCCQSFKAADKYPESSIKEIWSGAVFNQLRNHIENDSLPSACSFCRTHWESGEYFGVQSRSYDLYLPIKDGYPTIMEFFLDLTCNLECIMCTGEFSSSIRKNREKLPPLERIYGEEFLNELEEFLPYLQKASFVGGEPFLIDYYYRIWERLTAVNPDCEISITTNGTILNNKVRSILEKGNFHITISLDGITKETYENIRLNADFDKVMDNLTFFHDHCRRNQSTFMLAPCPQKKNWFEMPKMVEFANRLNTMLYFSTAVRYPFHVCLWTLPSEDLKNIFSQLTAHNLPSGSDVEKHNLKMYKDLLSEVEMWIGEAQKRENPSSMVKISSDSPEIKQGFYSKLTEYVNTSGNGTEDEKNERLSLLTKRIDHLLSNRPDRISSDDIFKFMSEIPMTLFVSWTETASDKAFADRIILELDSPYR